MRQGLQSGGRNSLPFKILLTLLVSVWFYQAHAAAQNETGKTGDGVFRFHMPTEPLSLDPALVTTNDASYFLNNVMRGLYSFSSERGLYPDRANACRFQGQLKLVCDLNPSAKWSDGSLVVAADYVRAFQRLVRPGARNLSIEILKNVKNALKINSGALAATALGVHGEKGKLTFDFDQPDPEFLYKLTSSIMVPVKSDSFRDREKSSKAITNGPYKVVKWIPGRRIRLETNSLYPEGSPKRPPVEILLVDDDETALQLYENGELTFLRRLPTTFIARYKDRNDFLQIPVSRVDYIGFGESLKGDDDLRAALALAPDYVELKKLIDSRGVPGCPGLNKDVMAEVPCIKASVTEAKDHLAKASVESKQKKLKLTFSKLGGDDVKKAAEWFQAQWKTRLNLDVELEQLEQSAQLSLLHTKPPPIYRKGVHPDRSTCLAALSLFGEGGAENFLKTKDEVLESKIEALRDAAIRKDRKAGQRACTDGFRRLIETHRMIPLGQIHFTLLARREFSGWSLNEMNQLDLSRLAFHPDRKEAVSESPSKGRYFGR